MSILLIHIRNSPVRWALPVLVALDLAVLFLRNRFWIGAWPETGAAAQVPAYLLGVLGAGAAAWAAAEPVRHRLGEQLAAARVPPARTEAYRLGATVVILLVPYLVGQAVAFALTARTFPPGVHIWVGYFVLGLFVTLFAVVVGWLLGRRFSAVFAALAATLGFLVLVALLDRAGGFIVVSGRPDVAVDPTGLALRLVVISVLLVALLWLPGADTSQVRPWNAVALVAAILVLAGIVVGRPVVIDRQPVADGAICVDGPARLCIWPEHEKYLPSLRKLGVRIGLLPTVFELPSRIVEFGVERTVTVDAQGTIHEIEDAPPHFYILEGSPWSYASDIAIAISAATFGFRDSTNCAWQALAGADQLRLSALSAWLEAYLAGSGTPDYRTDAPTEVQRAFSTGHAVANELPQPEQFEWAEQEVNDLRGRYCRPAA